MSNRLPIPGGDVGSWGDILNAYLSVSHATDGTLNSSVVGTSQLQAGSVTNSQLDASTQNIIASVASKYVKPAGGIPSSDLTSGVQANLTAASTAVQNVNGKTGTSITLAASDVSALPIGGGTLTGKLTVPSFQVTGGSPSSGWVLTADSSGNATWQASPAGFSDPTTTKGDIIVHGTGSTTRQVVGSDGQILTADSTQGTGIKWAAAPTAVDATTSTKGVVELTNDLGGTATSPTVIGTHLASALPINQGGTGSITQNFVDLSTSQTIGGAKVFSSVPTAAAFAATGLSGTGAARFVGGVTSGAPSLGTFILGDYVIDQTGKVWVCTTAGSPGVWTQVGAGGSTTLASDTDVVLTGPSTGQVLTYDGTASKWKNQAVPDATSSSKGMVQLAGDLSGSATSPTVAKLNGGITLPGSAPSASGQVLTTTSSGVSATTAWTTPAGGVTLDSTAGDIQPLGVQAAGSVGKAADAGHIHAMPRLDQVNAPTVAVGLNSQKITGLANGTVSTDAAAFGQIPNVGTTAVGGDLSGTVASATVAKLNGGITLPGSAPSASGQVLTTTSSGVSATTAWTTPAGGVTLDSTSTDIAPLGTQAAGSVGKAADAGHVHAMPTLNQVSAPTASVSLNSQKITSLANGTVATDAAAFGQIPSSLPPNGSASGDLSGSYPGPTVAKLNGVSVSGTPSNGQILTASSSSAASWAAATISALAPTTVQTSAYSAAASDFVPVDVSSGAVTVTLPSAPADKTRIAVKLINVANPNTNLVTIAVSGSDVFNKAGGGNTLTLSILNQAVLLQYASSGGIWYVQADDLPLTPLTNTLIPVFNVKNYGAYVDAKAVSDAAITNGATTLTSSTAGFTSSDVGKYVSIAGAGAAAATLTTTISAFTSSTQVTLTASASTTVSGANMTFGHDDGLALQAAYTAANNANGGIVYIPSGTIYIATQAGAGSALLAKENLSGFVTIKGAGRGLTTIKLVSITGPSGASVATLLGNTAITASTSTLQRYALEDFTVDASLASNANQGVVLHFASGANDTYPMQADQIEIRRVDTINVSNATGPSRHFLKISTARNTITPTNASTMSNIIIEDCYSGRSGGGGAYGIEISGFVGAVSGAKVGAGGLWMPSATQTLSNPAMVTLKNVFINKFSHDTGQTPVTQNGGSGSNSSVGVQLGGDGMVESARLVNCSVYNVNDCAYEIDSGIDVTYIGCLAQDCFNTGFLTIPYGAGTSMERSNVNYIGCRVRWQDKDTSGGTITHWQPSSGFNAQSRFGCLGGNVAYSDCHVIFEGAGWTASYAHFISNGHRKVLYDRCMSITRNWSMSTGTTQQLNHFKILGVGERISIVMRDCGTDAGGAVSASSNYTDKSIQLSSATDLHLTIEDFTKKVTTTSSSSTVKNQILDFSLGGNIVQEVFTSDYLAAQCGFDSGVATNYTFSSGLYTASSNLTTENRAIHYANLSSGGDSLIGPVLDGAYYWIAAPGSTLTGYKAGAIAKRTSSNTYLEAYVYNDGTSTYLCLDKINAGTRTSLLSGTANGYNGIGGGSLAVASFTATGATSGSGVVVTNIATGTQFAPRIVVQNNTVYAEYITAVNSTTPTLPSAPSTHANSGTGANVFVTLTGGDITTFGGSSPLGNVGWSNIPIDSAATLTYLTCQRMHVMNVFTSRLRALSINNSPTQSYGFSYAPASTGLLRMGMLRARDCDFASLGPATSVKDFSLTADAQVVQYIRAEDHVWWSKPAPSTFTVSSSPATFTNPNHYAVDAYIYGGTLTTPFLQVSRDGGITFTQVAGTTGDKTVRLQPNEQLKLTYTVAPTGLQLIPVL